MKPICIDANVFIASTKGDEAYSSDCRRVVQAVADGEFYPIEPLNKIHKKQNLKKPRQRLLYQNTIMV